MTNVSSRRSPYSKDVEVCHNCPYCKRIIVKDIKRYLKKYPEEKWMACPYCGFHFLLEKIRGEIK